MEISPYDDVIDSRDVIERLAELRAEYEDLNEHNDEGTDKVREETLDEIVALEIFLDEIRDNAGDSPEDGVTLINQHYFVTYAQELAEDIGAIPMDAEWPVMFIDWDAAAEALEMDYNEISFEDSIFLVRA